MRYSVKANPRRRNHRNFFTNEFDFLFNELINHQPAKKRFVHKAPAVNVIEEALAFKLEVAIPGVPKENVSLKIEEDTLIISAAEQPVETAGEKESIKVNYTLKEFDYNQFTRRFQLNDKIDKENIDARFENGILEVVLPKIKEEVKNNNRIIEIK